MGLAIRGPIRNLATLAFGNAMMPALALLVAPLLARELGPDGRGLYAAYTSVLLLMGVVGTFGAQDGLTHFVAHRGWTTRNAARASLLFLLPASFASVLIVILASTFLFGSIDERIVFFALSLTLPVQILFNMAIGIATGSRDYRAVNLLKVIPAVARTIVIVGLCVFTTVNAAIAAAVLLLSPAVGLAWYFIHISRSLASDSSPAVSPSLLRRTNELKPLIRFSLGVFPGVLASMAATRLDQVIGLPLIGADQLGLYAAAVSIAEIPLIVGTAGRSFVIAIETDGLHDRSVSRAIALVLAGTVAASGGLALVSPWFIPWFFGSDFAGAVIPTIILLVGTVIYTALSLASARLIATKRTRSHSLSLTVGAVAGLVALVVLSRFGAIGAAMASVIGYIVGLAVALIATKVRDPGAER